jgi:hypothetical protein
LIELIDSFICAGHAFIIHPGRNDGTSLEA